MTLADELERIAALAATYGEQDEVVTGVLAAEPAAGRRVYLCSYATPSDGRSWLALDGSGAPLEDRHAVREAVSILALCELAAETAGGGDVEALRGDLLALRLREHPPGIEEAEGAALELERALGSPPRLATPGYLDDLGAAVMRLEQALGNGAGSPFAAAMRAGSGVVESLSADVEAGYKRSLR